MIGVAPLSGTVSDVHDFVRQHGISYPTLVDPGGRVGQRYGLEEYPLTVLIDRRGVVRWVHRGFRSGEEAALQRKVTALLKPPR